MPGHDVHLYVDYRFFGRTYPRVHKEMDKMVKYYGWHHRIFFHDYVWARHIAIREYPNDPNAIWAAWLHLWTDKMCSEDPDFRRMLEDRAEVAKKQREQMAMWRKQLLGGTGKSSPGEKRTQDLLNLFYEQCARATCVDIEIQKRQGELMVKVLKQVTKPPKRGKDYNAELIKFYKKLEAENKKTLKLLLDPKKGNRKRKRR